MEARRIDRIAQVVAGTIIYVVVFSLIVTHEPKNHFNDGFVVLLAIGADEVGLADRAFFQDRQDGR